MEPFQFAPVPALRRHPQPVRKMELALRVRRLRAVWATGLLCVLLLGSCAQQPAPSPPGGTPTPGVIYNYARYVPGPMVILDGTVLLGGTQQDSLLRELGGAMIDSIRVYPADSTTSNLFGSRGVDGVVVIATRRRP